MSDQKLPIKFAECVEFNIPAFHTRPTLPLSFTDISNAERRLSEAQAVNGATYSALENLFNEGYREAKKNLSIVRYEITQAKKHLRQVTSIHLLDNYPDFLKEKGLKDHAANREAYLARQEDYEEAMDRLAMLEALKDLLEGKVQNFVNVCRYMKKEIDILIKSGIVNNKYTSR